MDDLISKKEMRVGDEVFVIYNNPHTPTVANIRAAERAYEEMMDLREDESFS